MAFPAYKQLDTMDCGPTCLRMIARYYGQTYFLQTLRERSFITRLGVLGVSDAAETICMRNPGGARLTFEQLAKEASYLRWDSSRPLLTTTDVRNQRI